VFLAAETAAEVLGGVSSSILVCGGNSEEEL